MYCTVQYKSLLPVFGVQYRIRYAVDKSWAKCTCTVPYSTWLSG